MTRRIKLTLGGALAALALGAVPAGAQTLEIDDSAFGLGTLSRDEGALPGGLWAGAEASLLTDLLEAMPRTYGEPAYLDLARRVLLSPAEAPADADDALAGAKLLAAAEAGFYREAGELAELAPQLSGQPALTQVAALSALLDGDVRRACTRGARLTQGRADPFFLRLRYLCYVDAGEGSAADLTLGLLRDQGVLSPGADRVLTALQTSGDIGGSVSPEDAFQYAAAQMLGAEVSPAAVPELPGSVLTAVARDEQAGADLRLPALERALSLRLIGAEEGRRLAAQMAQTPLAAEVVAVATERPGSLESAEAVARSLRAAPGYEGFRARAVLYRDALAASEPTLGYAPDADLLALAALLAGEPDTAKAWLDAMRAAPEADAARVDALAGLLDLATGEARVSTLPLGDTQAAARTDMAGLVEHALGAARSGAPGAAALAALGGLGVPAEGEAEAIRERVVLAMLGQSGLGPDLAARIAIDQQAAALFVGEAARGGGGDADGGEPVPRIKPEAR